MWHEEQILRRERTTVVWAAPRIERDGLFRLLIGKSMSSLVYEVAHRSLRQSLNKTFVWLISPLRSYLVLYNQAKDDNDGA